MSGGDVQREERLRHDLIVDLLPLLIMRVRVRSLGQWRSLLAI